MEEGTDIQLNSNSQQESVNFSTYKKLEGSIDHGKEYEQLLCALFALKLCKNEIITNFEMTSNNKDCGLFDDIEVKLTLNSNQIARFCFQIKHKENEKPITNGHLNPENKKKDFAVMKYFESITKMKVDDNTTCVLFTNSTTPLKGRVELTEEIIIEEIKEWAYSDLFLNSQQSKSQILKIQNSKNKFYLITGQDNVKKTESQLEEIIKSLLDCQIQSQFLEFIRAWWAGCFVLYKHDVICKLTELALSPFLKSLSDNKINNKTKIITKIIENFPITIIEEDQGIIENIFEYEDDENFNKAQLKFKISKFQPWKTLWYLYKLPLIIKLDETNSSVIQRVLTLLHNNLNNNKIIVIGNKAKEVCTDWKYLNNLSDVIENKNRSILENFQISLQGKEFISLLDLLKIDEDIAKLISVSHLLTISQKPLVVGTQITNIVDLYVERKIIKNNEEYEEKEILKDFHKSLHIICAPPGMGKSTLLKVLTDKQLNQHLMIF